MNCLEKLYEQIGSQEMLAKKLGISQQSISRWMSKGVPLYRLKELVKLSKGEILPHEFCPEIFKDYNHKGKKK